jgi:hypothetical protein
MGALLAQMAAESRGFVIVGSGRWHYRSVGQQDFYNAFYGNLVLISKSTDPETAKLGELADDDPEKLQAWLRMLERMGPQGQMELAMRQKTTVSAGLEGISLASEECKRAGQEGHTCVAACFKSYEAIKFVPRKEDERPADGLIHIDTIPPPTVTAIFSAIMSISTEEGRAGKRHEAFRVQSVQPPDPGRDRAPVRSETEPAPEGLQP